MCVRATQGETLWDGLGHRLICRSATQGCLPSTQGVVDDVWLWKTRGCVRGTHQQNPKLEPPQIKNNQERNARVPRRGPAGWSFLWIQAVTWFPGSRTRLGPGCGGRGLRPGLRPPHPDSKVPPLSGGSAPRAAAEEVAGRRRRLTGPKYVHEFGTERQMAVCIRLHSSY